MEPESAGSESERVEEGCLSRVSSVEGQCGVREKNG
jgi:hypothetical protein